MNASTQSIARTLGTLFVLLIGFAHDCHAHGFGERYDLPVPMLWVNIAACCVVAMSFLLTPFLNPSSSLKDTTLDLGTSNVHLQAPQDASLGAYFWMGLSSVLLVLTWTCASFGIQDALMNFAPTFIWIIWWLGTSFACLLFGNIWSTIDPWMGLYLAASHLKTRIIGGVHPPRRGARAPLNTPSRLKWPESLGRWPACLSLLMWCGLEIIYPIASMPERLGAFIIFYSVYTWIGMFTFGAAQWRRTGDGFSLYFELIAQLRQQLINLFKTSQQLSVNSDKLPAEHRPQSLRTSLGTSFQPQQPTPKNLSSNMSMCLSTIGLVMAMFSSVLFDGLHASQGWLVFERWVSHWPFLQYDLNGYVKGSLGLGLLWASLSFTYMLTCHFTHRMFFLIPHYDRFQSQLNFSTTAIAISFLSCLLPIAVAYLIAHNFSSFFIQGQNIIALASDPYGFGWNLWGTAHFYPDITLIDAKLTWYVASISIVLGHVLSIFMAHQTASHLSAQLREVSFEAMLRDGGHAFEFTTIKPWILNLPMTLVMIGFTALSLSIIAEPLTSGSGF